MDIDCSHPIIPPGGPSCPHCICGDDLCMPVLCEEDIEGFRDRVFFTCLGVNL